MILWGCLAFIVGMVFGACTHEHLWSFVASLAGVCEAARQAGCDFVKLENTDDSEDEEEKKKNIHSKVKSKPKMATLDEGRAVFLNFPAGLVDHLSFAKDGRLVHEFWYNEKEKEILYDDPGATDEAFWDRWCRWLEPVGRRKEPVPLGEFKYAKLITKNSAHNELGVVLVLASLTIYTLATQADFAMECLETYMERGNHLEAVWDHPEALWNHLEAAYAVIFALKLLTWVAINWVPAKRHIEADKKAIGDFVRDLCSVERAKTRIFVLLFLLLGVPSELTDAPIQLHIRKPVQPYAVFKAKGHRAWVAAVWARVYEPDPTWFTHFALAVGVAGIVGWHLGTANFNNFGWKYFAIKDLKVVTEVDAGTMPGSSMTDAGIIHFTAGHGLSPYLSWHFKSGSLYCAAPILSNVSMPLNQEFDYWAVGKDCCSTAASDFRCGSWGNVGQKSGIRVMNSGDAAKFRLAVQQAESLYNIRAPRPIFLEWSVDPSLEVSSWANTAFENFLVQSGIAFVVCLFSVAMHTCRFSWLGRSESVYSMDFYNDASWQQGGYTKAMDYGVQTYSAA